MVDDDDFEFEGERGDTPLYTHIIAGSSAGVMEHVAIYPMDTIKTHMQANKQTKSIYNIVSLLYKDGWFSRFWKGSSVIAAGCIPAHAAYFSVYEYSKKLFGVNNSGFQFLASGLTGAFSTVFHDLIITPYDGKFINYYNYNYICL